MHYLQPVVAATALNGAACPVITLIHNEIALLPHFLRHHRKLGFGPFLMVDDKSTDGSGDYLAAQGDVLLFRPKREFNYRDHGKLWAGELADTFCDGRWFAQLDADELLVYPDCETMPAQALVSSLDAEGATCLFTPMVDMYSEQPLGSSVVHAEPALVQQFPFFDRDGYYLVPTREKRDAEREAGRTPQVRMLGGARMRLFYPAKRPVGGLTAAVLRKFFAHDAIHGGLAPPTRVQRAAFRQVRAALPKHAANYSKLGPVKWRQGLTMSRGQHNIDGGAMQLSRLWGARLHFKLIDVAESAKYKIARAMHSNGSEHYKTFVADPAKLAHSALYAGSVRYTSSADLLRLALMRTTPAWRKRVADHAAAVGTQPGVQSDTLGGGRLATCLAAGKNG